MSATLNNSNSMRTKICAGNWKLFKTPPEAVDFLSQFGKNKNQTHSGCEFIIFPPVYNLSAMQKQSVELKINLGAQNIFYENSGAFTGENSPVAVKQLGAQYALIGHSERRTLFGETDEMIAKKMSAATAAGLTPLLCIGESLSERQQNKTNSVLEKQLKAALTNWAGAKPAENAKAKNYSVENQSSTKFVIAYEPVWAIGTGQVATPEQAEEAHAFIRTTLGEILNPQIAQSTSILYGGSVKPDNSAKLALKPNIDGFLIGGASLEATSFLAIAACLKN